MSMDEKDIVASAALPSIAPASAYMDDEVAPPAGATSIVPFQNKKITKLGATEFNQWYTSSCVFHAFLTALEYEGIITKDELKSQLAAYRKRINYPNEGSVAYDAWDKIREGVIAYDQAPTPEGMREAAANAMQIIKGDPVLKDRFNYFEITDYSKIAGYVAAGKAIPVFIFGTEAEWAQEYVDIKTPDLSIYEAYIRHAVVEIPKGDFTEKGVQRLSTHDSARFGKRHLRHVSNDFLMERCYYAARIERKEPVIVVPPPVVNRIPGIACKLNDRSDAVFALQRFLHDQGKLRSEYITGFYGALTAKAVLWYQLFNHDVFDSSIPELLEVGGESWGPQSIASLTARNKQ